MDVMVSVGPNFFYTVRLPCTLWFLDRGKSKTQRKDKCCSSTHRTSFGRLTEHTGISRQSRLEFIANIVRLYRGEDKETEAGSAGLMKQNFPRGKYVDVAGLCKVATLADIEAQGWSLNPGRYIGVAKRAADDFEFMERLEELNEELRTLNSEATELQSQIAENVSMILRNA